MPYWLHINQYILQGHTQTRKEINVWAGILVNHIGGPIYLEEHLTGDLYLGILQNFSQPLIPTNSQPSRLIRKSSCFQL